MIELHVTDKLWADRRWLASPREYEDETDWKMDMTHDTAFMKNKEVLLPQARVGVPSENGDMNTWSILIGAICGAGTVLVIALLVLIWRKPRRRELPMLAPMDVAINVSTNGTVSIKKL